MNKRRGYTLVALLILMGLSGLTLNLTATPATKTIASTKAMRASAAQGWVHVAISPQAVSHDSTYFYYTTGFGVFGVYVLGGNVTVTSTGANQVTYHATAAGTQSIRAIGRGVPTASGGVAVYHSSTEATTITTAGAGDVILTYDPLQQTQTFDNYKVMAYMALGIMGIGAFALSAMFVTGLFNGGSSDPKVMGVILGLIVSLFVAIMIVANLFASL